MGIATCAFTGHRPKIYPWKYDETDSRRASLNAALVEQIIMLVKVGVTDFFSWMAEGTDCYCSQIVIDQHIKNPALKLQCALPYEGQSNNWSDSAQERYNTILEQADSVDYGSRAYNDCCMISRNHRLVELAGRLLAVYNGMMLSGTGSTVNYARKLGQEISVIDPNTLAITHEGTASDLTLGGG